MACCADEATCPMHKAQSSTSDSKRVVSQAQADSCCAFSEGATSGPSSPTFLVTISPAAPGASTMLPAETPALVLSEAWRNVTPLPAGPVPRYVLLSVFLV